MIVFATSIFNSMLLSATPLTFGVLRVKSCLFTTKQILASRRHYPKFRPSLSLKFLAFPVRYDVISWVFLKIIYRKQIPDGGY